MLRYEVSLNDAVFAIFLYEAVSSYGLGESVIGVQPCLHLPSRDLSVAIGRQHDARMQQMKKHILNFCHSYFPSLVSLDEEDYK